MTNKDHKQKKNSCLIIGGILLGVIVLIIALIIGGCGLLVKGVNDSLVEAEKEKQQQIKALYNASPSEVRPDGNLKELFELMSENTDIQRENAEARLTGKIVEWQLCVFEVTKKDGYYRIQTDDDVNVGTFIDLYPDSDEQKAKIESLITGDVIRVRGYISGVFMRNLEIAPAILLTDSKRD